MYNYTNTLMKHCRILTYIICMCKDCTYMLTGFHLEVQGV